MLDMGQYNAEWRHVHMAPEEAAAAADDLRCTVLLPVHAGKFCIAYHSWDDPFKRITAEAPGHGWQLATPRIGEALFLDAPSAFSPWWDGLA